MGSPITIGALSTTAPPSEARSAPGPVAPVDRAGTDDGALIEAVRAGNLHAYGVLYERHVAAVRGLARRLCGNQADADDVVADVFTNTLRAIKSGRGPRDQMRSYVLTSTRHTVIKLRTRRDSGRAIPTADEQLDAHLVDDPFAREDSDGDTIGAAFVQLPDRFQNVLWLSCVEEMPPAEVGRHTELSAGAVSSLTLRARRALARSYLVSRISQPIAGVDCAPIRDLMPSVIREEAAPGTIARVHNHVAACCECREAFDDMQSLAASMRSFPWLAAVLAWLRSVAVRVAPDGIGGLGGTMGLAPVLVTAVAVLTLTAGDAPASAPHGPAHAAVTPLAVAPADTAPTSSAVVGAHVATTPHSADYGDELASSPVTVAPTLTALREAGVPSPNLPATPALPPLVPATGLVAHEVVAGVAEPVGALVDNTVGETVGGTLDAVDQLGQQIAATSDTLGDAAGELLGDVDETVVGVLEGAGAEQLAAAVEPTLDAASELLTTAAVEPVTQLVGDTAVGTTSLVTSTTSDVLGLTGQR